MGIDPVQGLAPEHTPPASATNPSRLEGGLTAELALRSPAIALSGRVSG